MPDKIKKTSINIDAIREAANNSGGRPGIYKMINRDGKVIYIGKAKHLKNRLISYTRTDAMPNRLRMMVSNVASVEITITKTEIEALLLENNLIKELKPFYNILLKDDKTFPYIVIDYSHQFPRVYKYRTLKSRGDNFFGPYPAISSLEEVLKTIQKAFLLRNCTDNCFAKVDRPCLQYFIKRCSAPCVGKICQKEYRQNVELAKKLLTGKDEIVRKALIDEMRNASDALDFEKAAILRDRIKAVSEIQSKQYVQIDRTESMDFIAIAKGSENSVVFMQFFRGGKNVGTEYFIVQNSFENDTHEKLLESFINQFYARIHLPSIIVLSHDISDKSGLEEALKQQFGMRPKIMFGNTGLYKKIIETALNNAQMKLNKENIEEYNKQLQELAAILKIEKISRIECYDNSHISGTSACGSMIVFEDGKLKKNKYRTFNIDKETANRGDDISMMKFVLNKRFKSKNIPEVPDLIVIDGGQTQLSAALEVLQNLDLHEKIKVISIVKQNNRKIGDEKILLENGQEINADKELLSFLILLRNEAHKEAITFHRKKRQKTLSKSALDDIPSIGVVRKRKLLEHFGSIDFIKNASVEDLKTIDGIDSKTAEIVFEFFNRRDK